MLSKLTTSIVLLIVLALIAIQAAITPQPQAMRPVSGPALSVPVARALTLEEALDLSLSLGDGRQVNFAPFGLGWEG